MTSEHKMRVRISRRFEASAERIFDAWLDPEKAGKFLFATESGTMVKVELDARVGGAFCFVDRRDGDDVEHIGQYLEIDRPRRLVFSFSVPKFSSESTRVTIEIVPFRTGCELTLTHDGLSPDDEIKVKSGWSGILDGLVATILSRKEAAIDFLQSVAKGRVREAFRAHMGPGFRHHNPFFRGDVEALMVAMEEDAADNPNKVFEVQRAIEEEELVAVHARVQQNPSDRGVALMYMFRFEGDCVVEIWDVAQVDLGKDSLNENGMF